MHFISCLSGEKKYKYTWDFYQVEISVFSCKWNQQQQQQQWHIHACQNDETNA